ncbi:MAG TPA: AAA family ATPase [Roseiflexaceae bacterium]|nr:AAA family ATPase [Roseiflexaceae bacterium]
MLHTLTPAQLCRTFDARLVAEALAEGAEIAGDAPAEIVGQGRAVAALRFGLSIPDGGFNIYAAGPPGIGKMTAVQSFIEDLARARPTPPDWCYVNNFDDPYQPNVIRLPAGRGRRLQQDVKGLIDHIRQEIPRVFESDEYGTQRDDVLRALTSRRDSLLGEFGERALAQGFAIQAQPVGLLLIPLKDGQPMSEQDFQALTSEEREELVRRRNALQDELKALMKQVRAFERDARDRLQELDRRVALFIVGDLIDDLVEQYADVPEVPDFLRAVQKDILENIEIFKSGGHAPAEGGAEAALASPWLKELPFRRYMVNVFVDNGRREGAPVVMEYNPSYTNLLGRIEKETQLGALYTDFTMIKPGAIHRALGGFLVIPAEDLLRDPLSWDGLKRALRSREIQIEEPAERLGFVAVKSLRPEAIPLDVKVVVVGPPAPYFLLHTYDDEFATLFKVKADFDVTMPADEGNTRGFLRQIAAIARKEGLRPLEPEAGVALLERSARIAEDQQKLSTNFGALTDLVREANFWAGQAGAPRIGATHIRKALEEKVYRSALVQDRLRELIARGTLLVDTEGAVAGQVNGLAVLRIGDHEFGKPSRITATAGPGRGIILDIEREVQLGGPIHSKGVLILSGYLAARYGRERPLTLAARLVFEQSYEGVDGDSASCAEVYALLSALADLPLRQDVAVTGSVNQLGQVQAVGGINEKIEGFFDVCAARGLTGQQGVMIPPANVQHLALRGDVVSAVAEGRFHIWAPETVDDGIELLTGVPAGRPDAEGRYPQESVNGRVQHRLRDFAERVKEVGESLDR